MTHISEENSSAGPSHYVAYVSHYLTGETLHYKEFSSISEALDFLNRLDRTWRYEAIGCSTKHTGESSTVGSNLNACIKGCGSCSC